MKGSAMRYMFLGLAVLASANAGCTSKQSPDELIASLSKTGARIEKNGSFTNEPPAEMNMKLIVDGEDDITASRFPSTDLARDYCQTKPACFTLNVWSVETSARQSHGGAWAKLLEAAGRPAPSAAASAPTKAAAPAPPQSCPKLDACCSDALAATSTAPATVKYACSAWLEAKQDPGKPCDEKVKGILDLYADPTNKTKVKAPKGCTR